MQQGKHVSVSNNKPHLSVDTLRDWSWGMENDKFVACVLNTLLWPWAQPHKELETLSFFSRRFCDGRESGL